MAHYSTLTLRCARLCLLAGWPALAAGLAGGPPIPVLVQALPYQGAWERDLSRFKIACKARQIGWTFGETLSIVMRLLVVPQRWYYLSASEARSAEAMAYVSAHCMALAAVLPRVDDEWIDLAGTRYKRLTVTLPNGSQVIGLPANARTARGCSGHLTLDEFAWHLDADKIWQAVSAFATWGYALHVISTPNGKQGAYYKLWTSGERHTTEAVEALVRAGRDVGDKWSRHLVSIHDAKEQGHPVDLATAREIAGNEENWQQEYCCQFLDEALSWLPYALIESCTRQDAQFVYDDAIPPAGPCYAGYDVARKRDLSVIWVNELRGAVYWPRGLVVMRKTPLPEQEAAFNAVMCTSKIRRACIDQNGIGQHMTDLMQAKWGETRVEGVAMMSNDWSVLAALIKRHLQQQTQVLPACDDVRRDLHSVRQVYTDTGRTRFEAPRTRDGHADRFVALGLALMAADRVPATGALTQAGGEDRGRSRSMGQRDWSDF